MRVILIFICTTLFVLKAKANENFTINEINWGKNKIIKSNREILSFKNVIYLDTLTYYPYYLEQYNRNTPDEAYLTDILTESFDPELFKNIYKINSLPDTFIFNQFHGKQRNLYVIQFNLMPIWFNRKLNKIFRIKSFKVAFNNVPVLKEMTTFKTTDNSVLSQGKWIKIKILKNQDGVYYISYAQLKSMGFSNPENVRVYGNGGGMLPLKISNTQPDDLSENAIEFYKGSDSIFNAGDYILFFGQGADVWNYNQQKKYFYHTSNNFSDYAYYFLTDRFGSGKQISSSSNILVPNITVTKYDDYNFHEPAAPVNLIHSGSAFYGDYFSANATNSFSFNFPNIDLSSDAKIYYDFVARSSTTPKFNINSSGQNIANVTLSSVDYSDYDNGGTYATEKNGVTSFTPKSSAINLDISFQGTYDGSCSGYLGCLGINVRKNLSYTGGQMLFRDVNSVGMGNIAEFKISNANKNTEVWDITNVCNPQKMNTSFSGTTLTFITNTDILKQFIAFDPQAALTPMSLTDNNTVANQNIHGASQPDMVIVAPGNNEGILRQAERLATYRKEHDGLNVFLTTDDKVYNEFSSGAKDVSSIRNMMKMFYDRGVKNNSMVKYLLLFGDGTYANKLNQTGNTNLLPTYESANSLSADSYITDDFFGWLEDSVSDVNCLLDIGVGRLPVSDSVEAELVVNKLINYDKLENRGDWHNNISFIADHRTEDGNTFISDADGIAETVSSANPNLSVRKIYVNAYPIITSSLGNTAPEVNKAINSQINNGVLIVNYTGHGSERQLSNENILNNSSLNNWTNTKKHPFFVTAACEVGRFDDFDFTDGTEITSFGEKMLLDSIGSIGLLTTSRIVYEDENTDINRKFYEFAFSTDEFNNPYRVGDIIRLAKNNTSKTINRLKFTLLGDPSMMLGYPKSSKIVIDSINKSFINSALKDTIKALGNFKIRGHISSKMGLVDSTFNGLVYPVVYDKKVDYTANSDPDVSPFNFSSWDRALYRGSSIVKKGQFSFEFIVPKDIDYGYGNGKMILYALDSLQETAGSTTNYIVGGLSNSVNLETNGPELKLYMNDTNFINGGVTNSNPNLLVLLKDSGGINTTGSGIGHDITAVIDDENTKMVTLNDYYVTNLYNYKSGSVTYPLNGLSNGMHTISVTAWDIFDNSTTQKLEFNVVGSDNMQILKVENYPNPFSSETNFVFEHNWPTSTLDIEIRIYSSLGNLVDIIKYKNNSTGFRTLPLKWNTNISQGIYYYQVKISADGQSAVAGSKMVIVR